MSAKKWSIVLGVLVLASMIVTACATPTPQVVEKVVTQVVTEVQTQVVEKVQVQTQVVEQTKVVEKAAEDYTTPHPILSVKEIRQAIAMCIDRDAAIAAVYPYVEDKKALRMVVGVPNTHWAYTGPYKDYPYDPETGKKMLDAAGWTLQQGATYRTNAAGDTLALKFTTTNAEFRKTWAAVVEQNLADCGIQLITNFTPASWWFGDTTGLARRDFELGAYAWVGQADPSGRTLYACDQIPLPSNNWEGQNYMGWCNQEASDAVVLATNTLKREDRKKAYDILWKNFAEDMVSLPMFQRAEAEAWSTSLEGIKTDQTEYATASAANWNLTNGKDTLVIGFSQEPPSMWNLVESAAVTAQATQLGVGIGNTQYNYDFQPVLQTEMSTIEAGLATNDMVDVKAGDMVYNTAGQPEKLAQGTKVLVDGKTVEYDGSSPLQLPQLVVKYSLKPYTWSDGTAGSIDDVKLAYKINCDKDSGATTFSVCDEFGSIDYGTDLSWTITYLPGVQDPTYFVMPFSISPNNPIYPSHQVLSDGRTLADVPAAEWATLPEIAEKPLSYGPWMITNWTKGQSIQMTVNPHYEPAPAIKNITIVIIEDTNQAVAQLLSGDVDYLEKATLGGGAEVQTVLDAAKQGKVNAEVIPSPTWEHIDFNLFTK